MTFRWPDSFRRIPDDDWTRHPVESLALKYDTVENHGWYRNLDITVEQLASVLGDGHVLVDYSGGTGILADRLLRRLAGRPVGIVIVDASPKFLRLALEKFRGEERIAFRHIRYLKEQKRLELLDEVLSLRADAIVSTNAIHLYYDLPGTLASWVRALKPGAPAFVQSGNIRNPEQRAGEWIIDETVEAIHRAAGDLVRSDARWGEYRVGLADAGRMEEYAALRSKFFLPVRTLDYYVTTLKEAGFAIREVRKATIAARVVEWYQFLAVYHEGVLGWVGGSERIEGRPPSDAAIRDRLELLRHAMDRLFEGRDAFDCCWTYVTASNATRSPSQRTTSIS